MPIAPRRGRTAREGARPYSQPCRICISHALERRIGGRVRPLASRSRASATTCKQSSSAPRRPRHGSWEDRLPAQEARESRAVLPKAGEYAHPAEDLSVGGSSVCARGRIEKGTRGRLAGSGKDGLRRRNHGRDAGRRRGRRTEGAGRGSRPRRRLAADRPRRGEAPVPRRGSRRPALHGCRRRWRLGSTDCWRRECANACGSRPTWPAARSTWRVGALVAGQSAVQWSELLAAPDDPAEKGTLTDLPGR